MPIVVPNNGEGDALEYFTNRAAPQNLQLRLYTNNITPAETDTTATYTEASGNGYALILLTGASWNAPSEAAPSSIAYAEQTFTFSGALGNVFGYHCTRATSGRIALAERFTGAPFNIANNGDQIKITPQITAD